MHYYNFHVGDYRRDTMGLSAIEDCAYRRILDSYYLNERAFNGRSTDVAREIGMREYETEVEYVLRKFFVEKNGEWVHERVEVELEKYRAAQKQRSSAGKTSAKQRLAKSNERSTSVQRAFNETPTNGQRNANEPITNNQEPRTNEKEILRAARAAATPEPEILPSKRKPNASRPDEIPESLWLDWISARKAKRAGPPTETAMAGIRREAALAGISLEAAIREATERGWIGFKAAWYERDTKQCFDTGRKKTNEELTIEAGRRVAQRIYDSATPEERAEFDRTHGGKVFCLSSKI